MQRARAATRVWRELPLWFPEGAELLEGVIDLVFEEDGALVIVDYKTDGIARRAGPWPRPRTTRRQLQLYGRGLAQALGMPVRERLVLFTSLGQGRGRVTVLHLVRHGQVDNPQRRSSTGGSAAGVSPSAGGRRRKRSHVTSPDAPSPASDTSPLERAVQTATVIAGTCGE